MIGRTPSVDLGRGFAGRGPFVPGEQHDIRGDNPLPRKRIPNRPRKGCCRFFLFTLLSPENQLETAKELNTAPTRISLYDAREVVNNEILKNSLLQIHRGRAMPVVPEMRAVWDAMRPGYQAVMGGAVSPEVAALQMQQLAVRKIREMNE